MHMLMKCREQHEFIEGCVQVLTTPPRLPASGRVDNTQSCGSEASQDVTDTLWCALATKELHSRLQQVFIDGLRRRVCWDAFQDAVGITSYSVQAFEAPGGNMSLANEVTGVINVGDATKYTIVGLTLQARTIRGTIVTIAMRIRSCHLHSMHCASSPASSMSVVSEVFKINQS